MILNIVLCLTLLLGAGNIYQYVAGRISENSYQKKITDLENKNTELKVTEKKQAAEIENLKKKKNIKARVRHAQQKVDETVLNSDDVVDFFRVRRKGSLPDAQHGAEGSPGSPTR